MREVEKELGRINDQFKNMGQGVSVKDQLTAKMNEQQVVADAIIGGKSIALLAPAGVGKSFILKKTLPKLKDVAIVAPTGVAAVNIGMGATTIHRLFGFSTNILQETKFNGSNGLSASSGRNKILSKIKTLVIDEIGMVRVEHYHLYHEYCSILSVVLCCHSAYLTSRYKLVVT